MSPELDMGIGMGMGFGMEAFSSSTATTATATSNAYLYGLPSTDTLHIDDLLDFSTQDGFFDADNNNHNNNNHHHQHHLLPQSGIPYSASATGNCSYITENSNSVGSHLATFPDDLYMPSEEAAELEWLSKFVEDSFSDMPFPPPGTIGNFSDVAPATADTNSNSYNNHNAVPGRARSKRSRAPATTTHLTIATTWSTLPPPQLSTSPSSSSSSSETKNRANSGGKKKDVMTMILTPGGGGGAGAGAMVESGSGGVRKCTHCSSEKTPQWRTGPLGPKTLCNACGVRYKSGRLVPEYRPASSPTFMLTQHSNSHRKVIELRRQKELLLRHQQQRRELSPPNSNPTASTPTRPDLLLRDYEVC